MGQLLSFTFYIGQNGSMAKPRACLLEVPEKSVAKTKFQRKVLSRRTQGNLMPSSAQVFLLLLFPCDLLVTFFWSLPNLAFNTPSCLRVSVFNTPPGLRVSVSLIPHHALESVLVGKESEIHKGHTWVNGESGHENLLPFIWDMLLFYNVSSWKHCSH